MDLDNRYGLMELNIKDNGKIIKLMVKEYFIILMEIHFKDNGNKIKQMDMEYIRKEELSRGCYES